MYTGKSNLLNDDGYPWSELEVSPRAVTTDAAPEDGGG